MWPGWDREPVVRSKGVNDFPYRVVYFVEGDLLTIVAVAHAKRRPGYWRDRVASSLIVGRRAASTAAAIPDAAARVLSSAVGHRCA